MYFKLYLIAIIWQLIHCNGTNRPKQIHLSPGSKPNTMVVGWITNHRALKSTVKYKCENCSGRFETAYATQDLFKYGKERFYTHFAVMENLLPSKRYQYKVGLKGYWSDWYTFKSLPSAGSTEPFRVAVYGDLAVGGILTEYLVKGAKEQAFDLIIHAGDIAYNFSENGKGTKYMNQLQEAFARVPYMIAIGNHEWYGDRTYVNMRKRFRMPNSDDNSNHYYSVDIGPIHFAAISTQLYVEIESHEGEWARRQWKWLERDFKKARSNSAVTPWIIAYHHHPFFCSSNNTDRCPMNGRREIRFGDKGVPGLEQLYVDYSVELVFEGHEHFYERFLPFNQTGFGVAKEDKKTGIREGTVHIITGAADDTDGLYEFRDDHIPESIVRKREYGYTLLTVEAPGKLKIEQIAVKLNSAVIDSLVLTKSNETLQF